MSKETKKTIQLTIHEIKDIFIAGMNRAEFNINIEIDEDGAYDKQPDFGEFMLTEFDIKV